MPNDDNGQRPVQATTVRTPESERYTASYRAIAADGAVKVYNGAGCLCVSLPMSFDLMSPAFSSVDMVAAAVASEVLLCIEKEFARRKEDLMDLEGRAYLDIANPLAALNVVGITGSPAIERIGIDVYLFTFLEEDEAKEVIEAGLVHAVLYQSLQAAFPVDLRVSFAQ